MMLFYTVTVAVSLFQVLLALGIQALILRTTGFSEN